MVKYQLMNGSLFNQTLKQKPGKKLRWQNLLMAFVFYAALAVLALIFLNNIVTQFQPQDPIDWNQLVKDVESGQVEKITVNGNKLVLSYKSHQAQSITFKDSNESVVTLLEGSGVKNPLDKVQIEIENPDLGAFWGNIIGNLIWVIPLLILLLFGMRQARQATGSLFDFGRARVKLFEKGDGKTPPITFADAAGVDEAKQELTEVVDFLKNPEKYRKLGARIPKGVLLVGPAGVGKTLLAKALAGEANVPFYSMAGSEFMEMLVGVGPSRVRDLFSTAKTNAPSIIFIDEIESIGRQRGMITVASHGEQEQTLNQILVEMDGFEPNTSVLVVAATNRPDLLDPALTRPGRFDRRVVLELPDIKGREEIIKIHMRGKPFSPAVSLEKLARRTVGFSGADIENMLNEAAILAARLGKGAIEPEDLEEAATKVKMGPQRKRLQSEEDKRLTAYHEAGHAIVAAHLPHMDPVHRVSIISRGLALGYTEIHPEIDRSHQTKTRLLEIITTMLGGRATEILVFDEMTVGAASDLENANRIARKMVTELGMSNLGPVSFGSYTDQENWRRLMTDKAEYSDEMAAKIDEEVKKILEECLARAEKILQEKRSVLDKVAEELVQKETLEGEEFEKLIKG